MSIMYWTIWESDCEDPQVFLELTRECFSRWAVDDHAGESLEDGQHQVGHRRITLRSIADDAVSGVEGCTIDDMEGASSTRWCTTVRVAAGGGTAHIWVENCMETNDPTQRIKVGRPRVVADLLSLSENPRLKRDALCGTPRVITADDVSDFVSMLSYGDRRLPVIVFTEPFQTSGGRWRQLACQTARRSMGVATVAVLDQAAVSCFRAAFDDLAVWGGGIRTYAPRLVKSPADARRHRFIPAAEMRENDSWVVDRLVGTVAQLSTRRRVPGVFSVFLSDQRAISENELAEFRYQWEFDLELEKDDHATTQFELGRVSGHLERIVQKLRESNLEHLIWDAQVAPEDGLPDQVQGVTEAIVAAKEHLGEWLTIADSASRELHGIDTAPEAVSWGNNAYRGFRALAEYARSCKEDGFAGGFWVWCQRGGAMSVSWPATDKKLAMSESESVMNRDKYRKSRIFDVHHDVARSGRLLMQAHLKISEGGGDLAPRIYFHDDTAGATGKVHVGFVGPHYLVPNTKS
ncbi:hypothetical protein [Streptomyces sp.]|uniref:hypothetical protein n=1 Tax=Streptomyces sp. TaxID=1931 RepID=UPI0028127168|nr:hypothetical protein [Streptomyces sp.]